MAGLLKAVAAILGLALVVLFGAWLAVGRARITSGSTHEADLQAAATPAPASRPTNSPGEAAAWTETETATFALG